MKRSSDSCPWDVTLLSNYCSQEKSKGHGVLCHSVFNLSQLNLKISNRIVDLKLAPFFALSLCFEVKWLFWNAAWSYANASDGFSGDRSMDNLRLELHFDGLLGYLHSPTTVTWARPGVDQICSYVYY